MKYNINDLTLKEKLGQMIILGLDISRIDNKVINLIKEYKIGGVVLYKKNYQDIPSMIKLINQIKSINKTNIPMFISIDQENGLVNRLPNEINKIPSQHNQVKNNIVNKCNEITIDILKQLGVNMNLAPVLDISRDRENKVNHSRSYSANFNEVLENSINTIKQYQDNFIIPVGKHFPGHGLVKENSHLVIPEIKDIELLEKEDLQVFKCAINAGLDAIMVGHLRIKGYGKKPAIINPQIINNYLKDYQGVIITDDIKMNYLKYIYGTHQVFINCINAGCNLIMIKYNQKDLKTYQKITKIVENNPELQNKVNISVNKIIKLKEKYKLTNEQNINEIDISQINENISKLYNK